MKNEHAFEMGTTGEDIITGFKGVITGYCHYLTGCDQLCLQPAIKKGKDVKHEVPAGSWFDVNRVKITDSKVKKIKIDTTEYAGGPQDNMPTIK